jgi:hypothetical protein
MTGGFDVVHSQRTCGDDDFGIDIIAAAQRLRRRQAGANDGSAVL